jgi:hypothetical protein
MASMKSRSARGSVPACPASDGAPAASRRRRSSSAWAVCLAPLPVLLVATANAQPRISFESADADTNGQLTRTEFASLPGFYGAAELFAEVDRNADRWVSREEWLLGFPDANGNRGSAKQAIASGARRGVPAEFEAHGPSVPRENNEEVAPQDLAPKSRPPLTGHGGANASKRGAIPTSPLPSPDEPPRLEVPPRPYR